MYRFRNLYSFYPKGGSYVLLSPYRILHFISSDRSSRLHANQAGTEARSRAISRGVFWQADVQVLLRFMPRGNRQRQWPSCRRPQGRSQRSDPALEEQLRQVPDRPGYEYSSRTSYGHSSWQSRHAGLGPAVLAYEPGTRRRSAAAHREPDALSRVDAAEIGDGLDRGIALRAR